MALRHTGEELPGGNVELEEARGWCSDGNQEQVLKKDKLEQSSYLVVVNKAHS